MVHQSCPTDRLPFLIQDELSPEESGPILTHLEACSSCQSQLEALAAEPAWWRRTTRSLSGMRVDGLGQLPEPEKPGCSVEALLEVNSSHHSQLYSSKAVLAMLDPPIHPEMLGRIDEFDIEEQIGQGGMGIVFRGFDRSLNRPVAVKVMAPHLGAHGIARKRFAREAQAAAAVVHPHVVPIYRVSSVPERPYIAMALVGGGSLQDHISHKGPLATEAVVRVSVQIAEGLAAAHRQGLIHRDVKPANILLDQDLSRVLITDFGMARAIDDVAMTQSGCLAGTPHYMSPEQVAGGEIDCRSDLFSLGSVMYFVATGREPFRAESPFGVINKITHEIPVSARSLNADVPETLDRIIGRLLEKEPSDRIESADELKQLLTEYLAHLQDPERHAEPRVKATRAARTKVFKRIGWTLAAVGLIAVLSWASFFAPANRSENRNHNNAGDHDMREGKEHHQAEHHDERRNAEHGDADAHN